MAVKNKGVDGGEVHINEELHAVTKGSQVG